MSWWDTSNFSSLASQALKNAQKKIDKVLDIEESEAAKRKSSLQQKAAKDVKKENKNEKETETGDFWSTWMGSGSKDSEDTSSSSPIPSSWNLPWAAGGGSAEADIAAKGDSDSVRQSESSSGSRSSSVKSKGDDQYTSSLELDSECGLDEGKWVGDTNTATSAGFTSGENNARNENKNDSISENLEQSKMDLKQEVLNVYQPDLVAVDKIVNKNEENILQNVELLALEENTEEEIKDFQMPKSVLEGESISGDDTCFGYEVSSADSEDLKTLPVTDDSEGKNHLDIQQDSVNSASGWDISDSVIKLVETSENNTSDRSVENKETTECENSDSNIGENFVSEEFCVKTESLSEEAAEINIAQHFLVGEQNPAINSTPAHEEKVEESVNLIPDDKTLENTASPEDLGSVEKDVSVQLEQKLDSYDDGGSTKASEPKCLSNLKNEDIMDATEARTVVQSEREVSDSQMAGLIQGYVNISLTSKDSGFKLDQEHHSLSDLELGTSATSSEFEVAIDPSSSTGSSETGGRLDSSADTVVDKSLQEGNTEERYSLFGDVKLEEEEVREGKVHSVIGDSVSPASSFVKCMLEEAMEESCKEDSGSDNHSNGSKSESSKLDSEFEKSIHSGQESSDDIETTTSSDIEIISAPGLGGMDDKQFHHTGFDLSPLKISIQQRSSGGDRHNHHHFDSHSSSSTQSKCGDGEELSPEQGEGHTWRDQDLQHPDLEAVQEEGADNPYHPERLLKKLAEMAEVLQARETKLVSMSKDNHRLVEDVTILRNQLQQSEEARESETADLKALTDEFTVRIGESEKKLQAAIREKESLKQQLTFTQTELEKRSQNTDVELLLEEKTDQVQELLKEGEKLSKQQLQSSNIIKKLRAKEKETDATLTSQKKKLDEQTSELEELKIVLDSKESMESKQADAINQLNAAVQKQDQDYSKALSDLEDAQEKNRGLQAAVDKAYKEIAELYRSNASQDSKAQEVALSKETSLREEMKMTLEREQQRFRQEREAFIMQADDLRLDMTKLEKEHNRREDLMREEIAHLQERLQQDEARSQDVSQSITSATRPLLRQIENLQATYGAQSTAWEKVEKNLTDRLAEAQISLAIAQEKERTACESEMEFKAKATSLESANARLKQDKAQLLAQRESDQLRLEELQDSRTSFIAQLENSKQNLSQELSQVKMEKVQLESHLTLETNKLENEKKKSSALEEQLHIMERERPKSRGTPSPSPSMSVSRQESLMGSFYERNSPGMNVSFTEDFGDNGSEVRSSTKMSVYENLRQSGATVVVENLQSQLKLREGENSHLQSEISQLERTRESMARELVNLSNQNDELNETKNRFENLEEQYKELNNRYSAILLMYGEKEEQVQELRLDLQDVKEMYKTQIDALLAK